MAKRMGNNPLTGLNSLIRDTHEVHETQLVHNVHYIPPEQSEHNALNAHEEQNAHIESNTQHAPDTHDAHIIPKAAQAAQTPKTPGRKGHKLQRINMAFSPENLAYLHAIAGFERMSATQYVNNLIQQDMLERQELYKKLNALRG